MKEKSNNLIFTILFIVLLAIACISTYRLEQAIRNIEEFTSAIQSSDSSDIENVAYPMPSDIDEKFMALASAIKELKGRRIVIRGQSAHLKTESLIPVLQTAGIPETTNTALFPYRLLSYRSR